MDSVSLNISSSTVSAGTTIIFTITQIINPPSTEPLTGIKISSIDNSGNSIDSCQASLTVTIN